MIFGLDGRADDVGLGQRWSVAQVSEQIAAQQRPGRLSSNSTLASQACGTWGVSMWRTRLAPSSMTSPSAKGRGGRSAISLIETMQPSPPWATCGVRRGGQELVHGAALVGLDVTERDPAQPLDRHDPLDGFADAGKHRAVAGVEQQRLVVVDQELVEGEPVRADLGHERRQPVDIRCDLVDFGGHRRSSLGSRDDFACLARSRAAWVGRSTSGTCRQSPGSSRAQRSPPGSLDICWSTRPVFIAVHMSTWPNR